MKKTILLSLVVLFSTVSFTPREILCQGFLPENDWKIPVGPMQNGGLSEKEFNEVLDKIQNFYAPVMSQLGGTLQIKRNWTDSTVNASANRFGSTWVLNMYGGLARVPLMTADAFMIVACHETGHHIGGAPKIAGWGMSDWASNEGEADYFSTLKCTRFLMTDQENADFVNTHTIDPVLKTKCETTYANNPERNLCMRSGTAGIVAGLLFQYLRKESTVPSLATPDKSTVSTTFDDHPATQCRMDTYNAGTVCFHDFHQGLSDDDPNVGTCFEARGDTTGVRPRCWFKP